MFRLTIHFIPLDVSCSLLNTSLIVRYKIYVISKKQPQVNTEDKISSSNFKEAAAILRAKKLKIYDLSLQNLQLYSVVKNCISLQQPNDFQSFED